MNNLIKEIENAIETAIGGFTQRISAKYNIKVDDLMELWSSKDEYKIATRVVSNKVIPEKPNTCEDLNESDNLELSEISKLCCKI